MSTTYHYIKHQQRHMGNQCHSNKNSTFPGSIRGPQGLSFMAEKSIILTRQTCFLCLHFAVEIKVVTYL